MESPILVQKNTRQRIVIHYRPRRRHPDLLDSEEMQRLVYPLEEGNRIFEVPSLRYEGHLLWSSPAAATKAVYGILDAMARGRKNGSNPPPLTSS